MSIFAINDIFLMTKKLFVSLLVGGMVLSTQAEVPEQSAVDWEDRVASLHNLAREQKVDELKANLTKWRRAFEAAPCEAKVSWVLLALNFDLPGTDRADLMHELKNLRRCSASKQLNNVHTAIGADYYELGIFDSAFHSFSDAFEVALNRRDTNEMVLSLSNMAALYSEMDWKVEALATALRAYSLAQSSTKISELTDLFLVNNVASLHMDMGYFDRAAKVLYGVDIEEDKLDEGQIHVLRAVNYARLKFQQSEGSERKIRAILERLKTSPAAFMMASSFAVADSLCPQSVLNFIHEEFRLRQKEFMADTATFVSFGIRALGGISLVQRIDESLRLRAFSLRDHVANLPLGADRLAYKLAIAQMFEVPDFWEDYWRENELIRQRDHQYAGLQNKILSDFNEQVFARTMAYYCGGRATGYCPWVILLDKWPV